MINVKMLTYPDVFDRREELTELMADLPVTLLVSENRSASFSSAAYVPSVGGKNNVNTRALSIKSAIRH